MSKKKIVILAGLTVAVFVWIILKSWHTDRTSPTDSQRYAMRFSEPMACSVEQICGELPSKKGAEIVACDACSKDEACRENLAALNKRLISDMWGGAIDYEVNVRDRTLKLHSLGRDHKVGGEGSDSDIQVEIICTN